MLEWTGSLDPNPNGRLKEGSFLFLSSLNLQVIFIFIVLHVLEVQLFKTSNEQVFKKERQLGFRSVPVLNRNRFAHLSWVCRQSSLMSVYLYHHISFLKLSFKLRKVLFELELFEFRIACSIVRRLFCDECTGKDTSVLLYVFALLTLWLWDYDLVM